MRRIAGIDALDDAMGRATELNRPVLYWMGEGRLNDAEGGQTVAALTILSYVARLAAKFDTPFIVTITIPETTAPVIDVCRNAYIAEGKEEKWNELYTVRQSVANSAYVIETMYEENVAVTLFFGSLGLPSLQYSEESNRVGALGIAGTARISNAAFLVACCDFVILSDEFYAGAAYLSQDKMQISTINTTDVIKIGCIAMAVIGPLLYLFGINLSKILYP